MPRLEVQGIVSTQKGLPYVQMRFLDDDGNHIANLQLAPVEAREMAQRIIEASMNAVYDAALVGFAKHEWPNDPDMGPGLLVMIREYRSDIWGLPDQPEDWRP